MPHKNIMKKVILSLFLSLTAIIACAQKSDNNTLKFLGIPVEGSKQAMITKLKAKGFSYNALYDKLVESSTGRM